MNRMVLFFWEKVQRHWNCQQVVWGANEENYKKDISIWPGAHSTAKSKVHAQSALHSCRFHIPRFNQTQNKILEIKLWCGLLPQQLRCCMGCPHSVLECLASSPGSIPDASFLLICTLRDNRWWFEWLGSFYPHGRPWLSSLLLYLAWPSPGYWKQLGSNPADEEFVYVSDFQNKNIFKRFSKRVGQRYGTVGKAASWDAGIQTGTSSSSICFTSNLASG